MPYRSPHRQRGGRNGAIRTVGGWDGTATIRGRHRRWRSHRGRHSGPDSLIAASRDPLAYEDPDEFDIRRVSTQAINFGGGIHHCLGAALAKVEIEETLTLLAQRFQSLSLAERPAWVPFAAIRRFESLKILTE